MHQNTNEVRKVLRTESLIEFALSLMTTIRARFAVGPYKELFPEEFTLANAESMIHFLVTEAVTGAIDHFEGHITTVTKRKNGFWQRFRPSDEERAYSFIQAMGINPDSFNSRERQRIYLAGVADNQETDAVICDITSQISSEETWLPLGSFARRVDGHPFVIEIVAPNLLGLMASAHEVKYENEQLAQLLLEVLKDSGRPELEDVANEWYTSPQNSLANFVRERLNGHYLEST